MEYSEQYWWLSGKESACNAGAAGDVGSIPGLGDPVEEGMTTHSSIVAWFQVQGSLAGYSL